MQKEEKQYLTKLSIRIALAIIIGLNLGLIYAVFSPLTLAILKLILLPFKPIFMGNLIIIKEQILEFIPACTAASAYSLLAILTLLTNISFKKMIKIFITGALIILAFNILRIFILILILIYSGNHLFETLHMFFWQVISTLIVVLTWILLTKVYKIKEIPVYSDIKRIRFIIK